MSLTRQAKILPSYFTTQLLLRVAVFWVTMGHGNGYECGGFIDLSSSPTGTIQSPGYPGNYPNYTRCIWMLEAPEKYKTQLTVNFVGETFNSQCSDYVEFRDGGQNDDIIQTNCGTMTSEVVASTNRWMYVFFTSDGFNQVDGLSATYSAVYVGSGLNSSITNPISTCRSYEFVCSNKLCLSLSYRCDGYYDCGCGSNCDEDGCEGLPLSYGERMAIGLCVGIIVFTVAATLGLVLEKHHNWEKDRKGAAASEQARRQGWTSARRDNKKAAAENKPGVTQPVSPRISSCTIKVSEVV